jgi:hypothetical protein
MSIFQLKVTVAHIRPPIWRRLLVPDDFTLAKLHLILQDAMGWENCHLHAFHIHGEEYGVPDGDFDESVESDKRAKLKDVLQAKDRFQYVYDFGDDWHHDIVVEKVLEAEPGTAAPRCLAGARACPPEDCGGPWGYEEILEALADPSHERHEELSEWLPDSWNADAFDLTSIDRRVAKHGKRPRRARGASVRQTPPPA